MNNIVLIGFMGVGKGTVARALAKESRKLFAIDSDDLIESLENRRIKAIFEEDGEEYFRDLEKRVAKWIEKSVKNSIISTGGGFFKVKNIKKLGTIVLLDAEFDYILKQILSHPNAQRKLAKRPLFKDKEKARELYDKRKERYLEVADIVINIENKDPQTIAKEILERVNTK